jgi:hypothetical protein
MTLYDRWTSIFSPIFILKYNNHSPMKVHSAK